MKELVIFDLDGTLLNTYCDMAAATNQALARHGFPTHDVPTIKSFVGNGINKLFERALPEGHKDMDTILSIRSMFVPYYNEHGTEMTFPFEGIVELLYTLQRLGIKTAVASNKYHQATVALMENFFPEIHFSAVLGQRDGIPVKPDPTIIHDILRIADVSPDKALYIGDSEVDMMTAINAGVDAIGVTWGCRSREELAQYNPLAVVDTADEIIQYIA